MGSILIAEDDRTTRTMLARALKAAGFTVVGVADGAAALTRLRKGKFDILLTDIWMPRLNGIELLARIQQLPVRPRAIVMTSDDTPETTLRLVREQAYQYFAKPINPVTLIDALHDALAAKHEAPPIEVISALPTWVELLVPCDLSIVERVHSFLMRLKSDLPDEIRDAVGRAFRELLGNAIEWGGKLDPNQKVRISYLRAERMLLYRIADPGPGFRIRELTHAAVHYADDKPLEHEQVRVEKGMRPGGFGILMTKALVDELLYNEAHNEVVFVKYLEK